MYPVQIFTPLDPSVNGELESVGEWLFETAARGQLVGKDQPRVNKKSRERKKTVHIERVYEAIGKIDAGKFLGLGNVLIQLALMLQV